VNKFIKVNKMGDSLYISLPRKFLKEHDINIEFGDTLGFNIDDNKIMTMMKLGENDETNSKTTLIVKRMTHSLYIILPKKLMDFHGVDLKVGDLISLNICGRTLKLSKLKLADDNGGD